MFHGCKYFWVAGCDRKEHAISSHYYLTKWTPPNKGISDLSASCAPVGLKKRWLIEVLNVGQVCSVYGVVWPVCEFAGDEEVEEGEGQNDNSGESDELPPKVKNKPSISSLKFSYIKLLILKNICLRRKMKTILQKMAERRRRERNERPEEKKKRAERKRRSERMRVKRWATSYAGVV